MHLRSFAIRPFTVAIGAALILSGLGPIAPSPEPGPVEVKASETTHAVDGTHDFEVPSNSTHVAVHWPGHADAAVTAAFSTDGTTFTEPAEVEIEDASEGPDSAESNETYGALMGVEGVRVVRVSADRPLPDVTVLALDAAGPEPMPLGIGAQADAGTTIPAIIPRSGWGADESIRFDDAGDEYWPREFFPLQLMVVHHTAGRNNDPNPAASVRAIYYYHAVSKRWADIGYNYLIDEAGRIYEGRYARDFWNGASPSSDNPSGLSLAAGHTKYHNSGSMGIALLGNLTSQSPTPAARASLVRLMAWLSAKHGIDPRGSSTYVNPLSGLTRYTANIAGHRDFAATGCPGGVLYAMLPSIRNEVAAAMNLWPGATYNPARSVLFAPGTYVGRKFNAAGWAIEAKSYTLTHTSGAPTNQKSTVPHQTGSWYYITSGVWAGLWIKEGPGISLANPPPQPVGQTYETARPLNMQPGTYVGRKFNTFGTGIASRPFTLPNGSMTWTTQKSTIPGQSGYWYYITRGVWEGYWIPESAGTSLGPPPPPLPVPVAVYDPPRNLIFQPGTYQGRRWSQYGVLAGAMSYTLTSVSSAPTSRKSALPGQSGIWYYIVEGVFEGYWIIESPSVSLAGP